MLGEKLGSDRGRITGTRILPPEGPYPQVESSFTADGTLLGKKYNDTGTYVTTLRPDGSQHGEGQGFSRFEDGSVATWRGSGVGYFKDDGGSEYRGAIYYYTESKDLERLNKLCLLYEYTVDADGNAKADYYEWR